MKVTLSGKEFTLRCDMRALANAKREQNVDISDLTESYKDENGKQQQRENFDAFATLVYYFAKSGAKHAKTDFEYDRDDFLGLIGFDEMPTIMTAAAALLGGDGNQKKAKASR